MGSNYHRIRTIKPEFFGSPDTAASPLAARLFYIAMWSFADDEGRAEFTAKELAAFAFPRDEWATAEYVLSLLTEVSVTYHVPLYEVAGRTYYAIPSWRDHQKPNRKKDSRFPPPEEGSPWSPPPSGTGADLPKLDPLSGLPCDVTDTSRTTQVREGGTGNGERETGTPRRSPSSLAALATTETSSAAPARRDDEPVTIPANKIVAAWIDAANENEVFPSPRMKGMVAKEIGQVLAAGNDSFRVLEAAKQAGAKGYPNVERELLTMQGRIIPSRQQPMGAADRAFATRAQVLEELRRDA